jgi:hypothetical protein
MNDSVASPSGTALYYPYIHPRDINQLKAALLFWDRVRRIVPPSAQDGNHAIGDNPDTRRLADEQLLIATTPGPYEEAAARRFFEHVLPSAATFTIDLETARALAENNRGIHIEKLGDQVLFKMEQLGLAQRFGEWVSMHDEVGACYMFCLASEMSRTIEAPLLSDSDDDAGLGGALLFEPRVGADATDTLARLGIGLPKPETLAEISVEDVAIFARKRAPERQRFRQAVNGILDTARSAVDPRALDDYLDRTRIEIAEIIDDYSRTLDELKVGAVRGLAMITVPAGIGGALTGAQFSPEASAILAATGIAISAIACYAETRGKLRQANRAAPYHYLLSLERELGVKIDARPK